MIRRLTRKSGWLVLSASFVIGVVGACRQSESSQCVTCGTAGDKPSANTNDNASAQQEVITSPVPPLPIVGGSLMVSHDAATALVSDPDRDRVLVVDLASGQVRNTIAVRSRGEPSRSVEDGEGRAYVVIRKGAEIMTIDLASGLERGVTPVCSDPRGVDYDPAQSLVHVACADGEVVSLSAGDHPKIVRTLKLEDDLRDVVVVQSNLYVSHFRSAVIDVVDASGNSKGTLPLSNYRVGETDDFAPSVAWRMIGSADGQILIAHQEASTSPVPVAEAHSNTSTENAIPSYVGADCASGIVHSAITIVGNQNGSAIYGGGQLSEMTLPVDVAISRSATRVAVVAAGSGKVVESNPDYLVSHDGCQSDLPGKVTVSASGQARPVGSGGMRVMPAAPQPIAVAYAGDTLIVQSREPSRLSVYDPGTGAISRVIDLGGDSRADTAHQMFHQNPDSASVPIACASCHPEGGDDGHVWTFAGAGPRRTQSLAGFSMSTAPFHWEGDIADVDALVKTVFVARMGGKPQSAERSQALANWLSRMPKARSSSPVDSESAQQGSAIFHDSGVGCSSCHSGAAYTDNATVDVGTGRAFQVPSLLGVGARSPYMHDGCATTLRERFNPSCGGGDLHGRTSSLSENQIEDLVSFLETL